MSSKKIRFAASLAAVVVSAVTLSACGGGGGGGDLLGNIQAGKVTLGTKYDQPGMGLKEADGTMTGLDVDVATYVVNQIASANGWANPEITWKESPSGQRETFIQNGEVDMIVATYSINKSRTESVNFGGPYLLTHQALLVRADDSSISKLEDLDDGRILCSVTGSTPAQKVKEALPGVQLQEYDTYSSCVEALRQGNVDALTTDATILNGYSQQNSGEFKVVELKKDGKPFTNEHYGIGLKKDDTAATDAVNTALEEMYSSGEFEKFVAKNLGAKATGVTPDTPGDLSFVE
jgi:hypothetical protein